MKNKLGIAVGVAAAVVVAVAINFNSQQGIDRAGEPAVVTTAEVPAPSEGERQSKATAAVAGGAAVAPASPLPLVPAEPEGAAQVTLWQSNEAEPDVEFDGNKARRLEADPEAVAGLHVGQTLHLYIPQRRSSVEAEIASTHNLTPRTQVWQGKIIGGHAQDNIIVTRGQLETHVTIATYEGTYSAVIDNATGDTVMVDEGEINANQIPHDDGIAIDPIEHHPPAGAL